MRLNSALAFIFLFVSAALSGPLRERDQSWVPNLVKKSTNGTFDGVNYNDNDIAGAFWGETDTNFTFATATFNVPAQSGQYDYTVFVAIASNDSMLFAGIGAFVSDNSETTWYQVWCYLGNSGSAYISKVAITPNDIVRISITAHSATSAAVLIENTNNGQDDVVDLLVDATQSLMGWQVWWGVELFPGHKDIITFDTLTITNAVAYGSSGTNYNAEGANKTEITQDNKVVTSVETKESTITIRHVHE